MNFSKGIGLYWVKSILCYCIRILPSAHEVGGPNNWHILFNWSISEEPQNNGHSRYNSAIMHPKANMSTGEL